MTYTDYIDLEGYTPGCSPAGASGLDGYYFDAPICERATCEACGHEGLDYRPLHKRLNGREDLGYPNYSDRAFAVCPDCGHEEEF